MSFIYNKKQLLTTGHHHVVDARTIAGYINLLVLIVDQLLTDEHIVQWNPEKNQVTILHEHNRKGTRDEDHRQIELFQEGTATESSALGSEDSADSTNSEPKGE